MRRCAKGLGNWLRLPGRHHKRPYWSRVWDGSAWLDGGAALDLLLSRTGDSPALVPPVPPPAATAPRRTSHAIPAGGNLSARIAAYVARLPHLSESQARDDVAYGLACWLVRDLDLADSIALDWLRRWDASNAPPKGDARLAAIIQRARAYGQRPVGCGLAPEGPRHDRHGYRILRATAEVIA